MDYGMSENDGVPSRVEAREPVSLGTRAPEPFRRGGRLVMAIGTQPTKRVSSAPERAISQRPGADQCHLWYWFFVVQRKEVLMEREQFIGSRAAARLLAVSPQALRHRIAA